MSASSEKEIAAIEKLTQAITGVPLFGVLSTCGHMYTNHRFERLHAVLTTDRTDEELEKLLLQLEAEDRDSIMSLVKKFFDDEELEKVWAYGCIFEGFADNSIARNERVQFMRCLREFTNDELNAVIDFGSNALAREHISTNIISSFAQRHPHTIQTLVRWQFWDPNSGSSQGSPTQRFGILFELLTCKSFADVRF